MLLNRAAVILLLVAGCGRCGTDSDGGGETPYARCLEADPPALPDAIGGLKIRVVQGRVIELEGLPAEPRVAVFQGPGMATALPTAETLARLASLKPDLLLMLGGLGHDPENARRVLEPIAKLGPPVLFLAGGRDTADSFALAREGLPDAMAARVIDLTSFAGLGGPGFHWVLVAGSEAGRESVVDDACGFAESDLADRLEAAKATTAGTSSPTLVSWEIPLGPLGRSGGLLPDVGSPALAKLRKELGEIGGLHAWPDAQVMRPHAKDGAGWGAPAVDLQLVAPRLFGPAHQRVDGTRELPGFAIIRFSPSGLIAELAR